LNSLINRIKQQQKIKSVRQSLTWEQAEEKKILKQMYEYDSYYDQVSLFPDEYKHWTHVLKQIWTTNGQDMFDFQKMLEGLLDHVMRWDWFSRNYEESWRTFIPKRREFTEREKPILKIWACLPEWDHAPK
jgi:hypothetical protein